MGNVFTFAQPYIIIRVSPLTVRVLVSSIAFPERNYRNKQIREVVKSSQSSHYALIIPHRAIQLTAMAHPKKKRKRGIRAMSKAFKL